MKKVIEFDDAIELLERAVAEKGEGRRVGHCVYFDPETWEPYCIVGQVLSYLGVPASVVFEDFTNTKRFTDLVEQSKTLNTYATFDNRAVRALQRAQNSQDVGLTWGTALGAAKDAR